MAENLHRSEGETWLWIAGSVIAVFVLIGGVIYFNGGTGSDTASNSPPPATTGLGTNR